MSKIVLLAIAFAAALWLLRGLRKRSADKAETRAAPGAEDMVRCARCGVHLPRGEGVLSEQQYFCSDQHAREFHRSR